MCNSYRSTLLVFCHVDFTSGHNFAAVRSPVRYTISTTLIHPTFQDYSFSSTLNLGRRLHARTLSTVVAQSYCLSTLMQLESVRPRALKTKTSLFKKHVSSRSRHDCDEVSVNGDDICKEMY